MTNEELKADFSLFVSDTIALGEGLGNLENDKLVVFLQDFNNRDDLLFTIWAAAYAKYSN